MGTREIKILSEAEMRQCIALDRDSVACVEDCFRALATRPVVMPPILSLEIAEHNVEADVKTAYIAGLPSFAIKMSVGSFDNPKIGLPVCTLLPNAGAEPRTLARRMERLLRPWPPIAIVVHSEYWIFDSVEQIH